MADPSRRRFSSLVGEVKTTHSCLCRFSSSGMLIIKSVSAGIVTPVLPRHRYGRATLDFADSFVFSSGTVTFDMVGKLVLVLFQGANSEQRAPATQRSQKRLRDFGGGCYAGDVGRIRTTVPLTRACLTDDGYTTDHPLAQGAYCGPAADYRRRPQNHLLVRGLCRLYLRDGRRFRATVAFLTRQRGGCHSPTIARSSNAP